MPFFILLLLASCGSNPIDKYVDLHSPVNLPEINIEDSFHEILAEFVKDCEYFNKDCNKLANLRELKFVDAIGDIKDDIVGICYMYTKANYTVIHILKRNYGEFSFKGLLYHELGHCILDFEHTDSDRKSIMRSNMLSEKAYAEDWNSLITDFFSGVP